MSENLLIGVKHELEVASELTGAGLVVSLPLVDIGVDLLASRKDFSKTVPVQVKYKEKEQNIFFTGKEIAAYSAKNVYIAYILADSKWYMPFSVFLDHAEQPASRKDQAGYIVLARKSAELAEYSGEKGFARMVEFINGP
ncbi:MAG: hypothetical protein RBR06_01885 [Desulfuromonadaceae bacterium]|nr:hypothetical protein [Desulfuromonadaceae bacterium]